MRVKKFTKMLKNASGVADNFGCITIFEKGMSYKYDLYDKKPALKEIKGKWGENKIVSLEFFCSEDHEINVSLEVGGVL